MKKSINKHPKSTNQCERYVTNLTADLTGQNQSLASQLRTSGEKQKTLRKHISILKQQFQTGEKKVKEHFDQAGSLREEISSVIKENAELERKVEIMFTKNKSLIQEVKDSKNRIEVLERKNKNHQYFGRDRENYVKELGVSNHLFLERLPRSGSAVSPSSCRMSLFSELVKSCSDKKNNSHKTHFNVIEETDEYYDIEDSGCEMLCEDAEEMDELQKEVRIYKRDIYHTFQDTNWLKRGHFSVGYLRGTLSTNINILYKKHLYPLNTEKII